MKLFYQLSLLFCFFISGLKAQQPLHATDFEKNPYWLIDHLNSTHEKYKSTGQITIGKCVNTPMLGAPIINHVIKTLSVTIPAGATIIKVYPFIVNIDGLKGPGGDPPIIPWGATPEQDIRWGLFHAPKSAINANGETVVTVVYDNWSDKDSRAGFLIVEYSGGNSGETVGINSSTTGCLNTVKFSNPSGTNNTVYLYTAEVNNGSTSDFCSIAVLKAVLAPGTSFTERFNGNKVLLWQSYSSRDCIGNNLVASGTLSNQCCNSVCEISVSH
ncbi:MAG TPA: hypothetical protein VNZ45_10555 [Bacteroidia bacterium]|jgi:hypothetical protein|nr:hypothetical protein [Bacteroidia bacterium]